jgi:7-carboxy-7-deazaguanine synthase
MKLNVSELFYSLQGEGARAGTATVFIRLQGCSAKHACYASGIMCDTEYESGGMFHVEQLYEWMQKNAPACKEITWTGGEPLDQLTDQIIAYFHELDYYQALETSGLKRPPDGLDFICVSPKVAEHVVAKNFTGISISELRYVRHAGQQIPQPQVKADNYWISPHSDGFNINQSNLQHCIELCKLNPQWKLSVQQHKLWNIL